MNPVPVRDTPSPSQLDGVEKERLPTLLVEEEDARSVDSFDTPHSSALLLQHETTQEKTAGCFSAVFQREPIPIRGTKAHLERILRHAESEYQRADDRVYGPSREEVDTAIDELREEGNNQLADKIERARLRGPVGIMHRDRISFPPQKAWFKTLFKRAWAHIQALGIYWHALGHDLIHRGEVVKFIFLGLIIQPLWRLFAALGYLVAGGGALIGTGLKKLTAGLKKLSIEIKKGTWDKLSPKAKSNIKKVLAVFLIVAILGSAIGFPIGYAGLAGLIAGLCIASFTAGGAAGFIAGRKNGQSSEDEAPLLKPTGRGGFTPIQTNVDSMLEDKPRSHSAGRARLSFRSAQPQSHELDGQEEEDHDRTPSPTDSTETASLLPRSQTPKREEDK